MATTYPTSKQTFTDPLTSDNLNLPSHAGLHTDKNDTLEAIQDQIGYTGAFNFALLAGRASGQTLIGDTASGGNLTLQSTSHATKGKILFGTSAYDEVNNRLGLGVATPSFNLSFGNDAEKTLQIESTANTVVGRALTVSAGSTVTGGTADMAGGNLTLASGLGKGTGASSIIFQTGRTLTTGSTLQTLTTAMTILGSGNVGIGTTNPAFKLDVSTSTNADGIKVGAGLQGVGQPSASANIYLEPSADTTSSPTIRNWLLTTFYDAAGTLSIRNSNAAGGNPYSAGTSRLLLNGSGNLTLPTGTLTVSGTGNSTIAGNVGIGTTNPTAKLHLPASTATANTASLKIDAGVVATTPVSGNIESDGTHLYWTDSGGTRRQLDN